MEVLAAFAEKRGITYPLLSDEGSHTIRALGLLNEQHLVEQHAFYGIKTRDDQRGVAYPGTFVLDKRGIISEKHFEQSYRVRPTARIFEEYALGTSEATRLRPTRHERTVSSSRSRCGRMRPPIVRTSRCDCMWTCRCR